MRVLALLGELLAVGLLALGVRRVASPTWRTRLMFVLKAYLTLRVMGLILLHEVDGVTVYTVLHERLAGLDTTAFFAFTIVAMVLKLIGISASITRWILMLRGQGVQLPVRHIVGAFFIGRFLGTFLPSTLGLDGYKLYDAARFSGRTVEVTTATFIEKLLGGSGVFGTFLIALPFGIAIFGDLGPVVALAGIPIALAPLAVIAIAFFWPGPMLVRLVIQRLPLPTLQRMLQRIADGATAYGNHKPLLMAAWVLSLVQHFTTAAMYYFTARALGVHPSDAGFWEVTFASSVQILATVLSPFTIAGEGIRELAQGLLLQNHMTFAVAAASGLLGFLAAEAPTLLGAIPWVLRGERYRPAFCRVDGAQVDWEEARRRATDLGVSASGEHAGEPPDPALPRVLRALRLGLGAGLYAGLVIGFGEATYLLFRGKVVSEAQLFWAAPFAYGLLFAAAGAAGGAVLGVVPMPRRVVERWVPALGFVACLVPYALVGTLFLLYRDTYGERLPPLGVVAAVVGGFALAGLLLLVGLGRLARTRLRAFVRTRVAVPLFGAFLLVAAVLGARYGPAPESAESSRSIPPALAAAPNMILIIVDTLRADFLPAYGATEVATPAIDRLAAGGTVFQAAFAQASWTKPSIASILTGLYPGSHSATRKPSRLPDGVVTIAEAFRGFGYTTGGIVTNINLAPSFNFHQGFDEYRYLTPDYLFGVEDSTSRTLLYEILRRVAGRLGGGVRPGQAYQPAEVVNARTAEWLDRHQDERFFLLLHYMEPHDPYFTHPDDGRAIARATTPEPDPALRDEIVRRYRGEIEYLDRRLGELVADLESRGLLDELLIVVTSDHGEEFLDHDGWWHGLTLYDELIGVPFLVKWPESRRGAPSRWNGQVRLIDIAPTLLSYVGAPVPPPMQGEDLLAAPDGERVVYAEEDHEGNVLQAIRTGGFKLIRANRGNPRGLDELELFHLGPDPGETRNLVDDEPARAEALLGDLIQIEARALSEGTAGQVADIGREECERLRALGYVQDCP